MFLTNRGTPEYYFPYTQIRAVAHIIFKSSNIIQDRLEWPSPVPRLQKRRVLDTVAVAPFWDQGSTWKYCIVGSSEPFFNSSEQIWNIYKIIYIYVYIYKIIATYAHWGSSSQNIPNIGTSLRPTKHWAAAGALFPTSDFPDIAGLGRPGTYHPPSNHSWGSKGGHVKKKKSHKKPLNIHKNPQNNKHITGKGP